MAGAMILEFVRIGTSQKVSAIDEESGVEVSFVAPLTASRLEIERLARAKLEYVIKKEK